jgi:hypothetical protein
MKTKNTAGVHHLRDALAKAMTPADFAAIAGAMVEKAKTGNASACKLLLETLATRPPAGADDDADKFPDLADFE